MLRLAREAGVDVGEVYEMDASRRTTAANAYVTGLGHTKRVVLYDTLLEDFTPAETRMVVAHELGHVHYHDMRNGLIWLAVVAPFGMWATALLSRAARPARRGAGAARGPSGRALDRARRAGPDHGLQPAVARRRAARGRVLAAADGDPETLIDFQRRIAIKNVSDPDPPAVSRFLLGTHPTTVERIGMAEAFEP